MKQRFGPGLEVCKVTVEMRRSAGRRHLTSSWDGHVGSQWSRSVSVSAALCALDITVRSLLLRGSHIESQRHSRRVSSIVLVVLTTSFIPYVLL